MKGEQVSKSTAYFRSAGEHQREFRRNSLYTENI